MTAEEAKIEEWLKRPCQLIVAFCSVCGGWTMFIGTDSDLAKDWTRSCYAAGDLIMPMRTTVGMGPSCPQSERKIRERTCDR